MAAATYGVGWRKLVAAIVMFGLGFAGVAGGVHSGIGDGLRLHADIRSEKLMVMDEWQGRAYSAAFGSSHMHNGFDPRTFDLTMQGSALQTRSLNLAIAGGSQSEQRVTALEFLRHLQQPAKAGGGMEARACLVLLELNAGANFTNDHLVHPRAINIYDWQTTQFVWGLTSPAMGLKQRVGRMVYAFAAMALHYANVGMLSSRTFAPPIDGEALKMETMDDRRGLLVLPVTDKVEQEIAKEIAAAPRHATSKEESLLPSNGELLEELKEASPVQQVAMAYVVMPKISDLVSYAVTPDSVAWAGGVAPVIDMARPDLYPEIYQTKYWLDDAHLNESGAALVTRMVAESLKHWYAAHGEPTRCGG